MPTPVGEPKQHKQPSRKSKRAWRKNVDISEIQDGLESLREEIRHGGPVAEKPHDELFVLDTTGSEEIKKRHNLTKPLKVDQILAERSAVPAVDSRKRSRAKLADGVYEPASKRVKGDWVSKKEVQRLKQSIKAQSHLNSEHLDGEADADFDLWKIDGNDGRASSREPSGYEQKQRPKVEPETLRRSATSMTATGTAVRAVQNPDGGTSYNPSFEEWDDLLNREGQKEVEREQQRRKKFIADAERDARVAAITASSDRESDGGVESAWEGFDTDYEDSLKKKRPERKTLAQRNKLNRRKEAEQLARHEKRMADRGRQGEEMAMVLAKGLASEVDLAENEQSHDVDEQGDDSKLRRRKMGNAVIPEKQLELVLPDELQESLRRLKPEGNLMTDRFRNLLVNGKIESRKPVIQPKKKKQTFTEKWSYKDFGIEV